VQGWKGSLLKVSSAGRCCSRVKTEEGMAHSIYGNVK
jgi:hypothetical protein